MKCDVLWFGRYQRFGGTDDSLHPANSDSIYPINTDKLKDITFTSTNLHLLFVTYFLCYLTTILSRIIQLRMLTL